MTVTYTGHVANGGLFAFSRLLLRWKGSIYKLVYKEMLLFVCCYSLISVTYRLGLQEDQRRAFEKVSLYCDSFSNYIPLSFILGFYVSMIVSRWWSQFMQIPWPDRVMFYTNLIIHGTDESRTILRRQLMRYVSLGSLLVFQATSFQVKKRFPTTEHLIKSGLMTSKEADLMENINTPHGKWWVPFVWISELLHKGRRAGYIANDYMLKTLMDEYMTYRGQLGMLYSYDWIPVPLVYTQVATLATYTFFLGCLFGRQFLDTSLNYPGHSLDIYVPIFTLLQFVFYMGWLKVAEQLINPFGEDDDDFDMHWIIDRNLQISLLVVDDLHGMIPPETKDEFWGEQPPENLPYTKSTYPSHLAMPFHGSTAELVPSSKDMQIITHLGTIAESSANTNTKRTIPTNFAFGQSPCPSPMKVRRNKCTTTPEDIKYSRSYHGSPTRSYDTVNPFPLYGKGGNSHTDSLPVSYSTHILMRDAESRPPSLKKYSEGSGIPVSDDDGVSRMSDIFQLDLGNDIHDSNPSVSVKDGSFAEPVGGPSLRVPHDTKSYMMYRDAVLGDDGGEVGHSTVGNFPRIINPDIERVLQMEIDGGRMSVDCH